jgi:hypothetical protein
MKRRDPKQLELFEQAPDRAPPPPGPKVEVVPTKRRGRHRLVALGAAERPRNRHKKAKPGSA